MKNLVFLGAAILLFAFLANCNNSPESTKTSADSDDSMYQTMLNEFIEVELKADLSALTPNEKAMLPLLIDAADYMDELFWKQAFGDKQALLDSIDSESLRKLVLINYGPWSRLEGNEPFIRRFGIKPPGAAFYPKDMSREEFENWDDSLKTSLYTVIRRAEGGGLATVPYRDFYHTELNAASGLVAKAAALADDPGLKKYLELRAKALLTDDYLESDLAWMDMKDNTIDFVVGPIETYEDALFGYKAAFEAFVLIKDKEWSQKLEKFSTILPDLQKQLPVDDSYKREKPGTGSDLGAYQVIYYAGDCNAGSKTIAINLPNDERVHAQKGSRRLQLKNTMKAKFDNILLPIAQLLIAEDQVKHVTFDAFFENVMFHEVAHGLGLNNTITGKGTVREALQNNYTTIEEGKADILGLFLVTRLHEMGMLSGHELMDNYVTFMAGIFRSVRFGASSSHGKANMIAFYHFQEQGAFERGNDGRYRIDMPKMTQAMNSLSNIILTIQGDGDFQAAETLIKDKGAIRTELQADLDRISSKGIPKDIFFRQGKAVLGL